MTDTFIPGDPQEAAGELTFLRQILRYQPDLLTHLQDLLDAVAAHLPRVIARRVIEAPPSGPLALPIEGTVMFADIDGFTPLSERFAQTASEEGAEELTELVNRFLEILIHTSSRYGGDIQKFGGDAGMLLFEGEQHVQRAIAASLEVQAAMESQMGEVHTSLGTFPLRIAIGLGSGRMVGMGLGNQEGREWLLTGAPLKGMGRAQSAAPAGCVVWEAPQPEDCALFEGEPLEEARLYLIHRLHAAPPPQAPQPLAQPPQREKVELLHWLISRLDALTPYLAPALLERLTTAADPRQVGQWSEHRQVTILMVSLAGFPELSIHWENPAALQRAVREPNDIFVRARDVIHQYDGIVNKIGASPQGAYLMALFGAPKAHEDDPLRAVLAALELQERAELPLRIGINSGAVFAGNGGAAERREYTVMGDEVNLAYRLMAATEPNQIWLGPNTARHPIIRRRVMGEYAPPRHFKGKADPIAPFIARKVQQTLTDINAAEELPLADREAELASMGEVFQQALTDGAQVILLSGAAGVGKTRLAHAAVAQAQTLGFRVYEGVAPSYGAHLPYAAWERPLLALLDLENVPQERYADAFEAALSRHHLGVWGALLAPLVGLDIPPLPEIAALTPDMREKQRQQALSALWAQAATHTPTLLILENAHWMPQTSLSLLMALSAQPAPAPFVLLITQRDQAAVENHWPEAAHFHTLALEPLSREATIALARQIAHTTTLPREVERWFVKRGGGIPLFTVEAVRTLLASGILARQGNQWTLTQPLEEAPLPETAYGMIQSRIDQLEPPSRHLLRAATVVGEQMTVPMLVAGYGEEPRPTVERRLPRLVPLGLVSGDAHNETLIFHQPLIREVAYHGLPFRIRRLIHRRLSEYLGQNREQATSNWLALLAYHAFEGQDWEQAIRANLELGKRAQQNYLLEQAAQAYRRVIEAIAAGGVAAPQARFEAEQCWGQILTLQGQYEEALRHFEQARQLLPAVPTDSADICRLARLDYELTQVLTNQGRYQEVLETIEHGLSLPDIAAHVIGAQLQMQRAGLFHQQGNYAEEEQWIRRSVEMVRDMQDDEALKIRARALYRLAYLISVRGETLQALELGEQSLSIYQRLHDLKREIDARNNLLLVNLALSRWDAAVGHGEQGLKLAQRIQDSEGEARLAANLGEVYRYQGRIREARMSYQLTLKIAQTLGITYGIALMENNLAALALYEDKLEEAAQHLDRAEMLFKQIGAEIMLPETYRHRSLLALALHDHAAALTLAQQSLALAEAQGARSEVGLTQRVLAEIYLAQGQCAEASNAVAQALAVAQANQDRYRQAQARLTQARLHAACDDPIVARETLDHALGEFAALGATHDLQQGQALLKSWE